MLGQYVLQIEKYCPNLLRELHSLQKQGIMCDVILSADDGDILAHKVVLMSASNFFKERLSPIFSQETAKICMKGLNIQHLSCLIKYIYSGKITIGKKNVDTVLEIAEVLELNEIVEAYKEIVSQEAKRDKETTTSSIISGRDVHLLEVANEQAAAATFIQSDSDKNPPSSTITTIESQVIVTEPSGQSEYGFESNLYEHQYVDISVEPDTPSKRVELMNTNSAFSTPNATPNTTPNATPIKRNITIEEAQHQDLLAVAIESLSEGTGTPSQNKKDASAVSEQVVEIEPTPDILVVPSADNELETYQPHEATTKLVTVSSGTVNNDRGGKTQVYTVCLDPSSIKGGIKMPRQLRKRTKKGIEAEEKAKMFRQKRNEILNQEAIQIPEPVASFNKTEHGPIEKDSPGQKRKILFQSDFRFASLSKLRKKNNMDDTANNIENSASEMTNAVVNLILDKEDKVESILDAIKIEPLDDAEMESFNQEPSADLTKLMDRNTVSDDQADVTDSESETGEVYHPITSVNVPHVTFKCSDIDKVSNKDVNKASDNHMDKVSDNETVKVKEEPLSPEPTVGFNQKEIQCPATSVDLSGDKSEALGRGKRIIKVPKHLLPLNEKERVIMKKQQVMSRGKGWKIVSVGNRGYKKIIMKEFFDDRNAKLNVESDFTLHRSLDPVVKLKRMSLSGMLKKKSMNRYAANCNIDSKKIMKDFYKSATKAHLKHLDEMKAALLAKLSPDEVNAASKAMESSRTEDKVKSAGEVCLFSENEEANVVTVTDDANASGELDNDIVGKDDDAAEEIEVEIDVDETEGNLVEGIEVVDKKEETEVGCDDRIETVDHKAKTDIGVKTLKRDIDGKTSEKYGRNKIRVIGVDEVNELDLRYEPLKKSRWIVGQMADVAKVTKNKELAGCVNVWSKPEMKESDDEKTDNIDKHTKVDPEVLPDNDKLVKVADHKVSLIEDDHKKPDEAEHHTKVDLQHKVNPNGHKCLDYGKSGIVRPVRTLKVAVKCKDTGEIRNLNLLIKPKPDTDKLKEPRKTETSTDKLTDPRKAEIRMNKLIEHRKAERCMYKVIELGKLADEIKPREAETSTDKPTEPREAEISTDKLVLARRVETSTDKLTDPRKAETKINKLIEPQKAETSTVTDKLIEPRQAEASTDNLVEARKVETSTYKLTEQRKPEISTVKLIEPRKAEASTYKLVEPRKAETITDKLTEQRKAEISTVKLIEPRKAETSTYKIIEKGKLADGKQAKESNLSSVHNERKDIQTNSSSAYPRISIVPANQELKEMVDVLKSGISPQSKIIIRIPAEKSELKKTGTKDVYCSGSKLDGNASNGDAVVVNDIEVLEYGKDGKLVKKEECNSISDEERLVAGSDFPYTILEICKMPILLCAVMECQYSTYDVLKMREHWINFHVNQDDKTVATPFKPPCTACYKVFDSKIILDLHFGREHKGETISCDSCHLIFGSFSRLQCRRKSQGTGGTVYLCTNCVARISSVSKQKNTICEFCGLYNSNLHLEEHHQLSVLAYRFQLIKGKHQVTKIFIPCEVKNLERAKASETPTYKTSETLSYKFSETSSDKASETSTNKASEIQTNKTSETQIDRVSETPTNKTSETLTNKVSEIQTNEASKTQTNKSSETSSDIACETSTNKASETPTNIVSEIQTNKSNETSTNKANISQTNKASETPINTASETPTDKSSETQTNKVSETQTNKAIEISTNEASETKKNDKASETLSHTTSKGEISQASIDWKMRRRPKGRPNSLLNFLNCPKFPSSSIPRHGLIDNTNKPTKAGQCSIRNRQSKIPDSYTVGQFDTTISVDNSEKGKTALTAHSSKIQISLSDSTAASTTAIHASKQNVKPTGTTLKLCKQDRNVEQGERLITITTDGQQSTVKWREFSHTMLDAGEESTETLDLIGKLLENGEEIKIRVEDDIEIQNV